VINCNTYYLDYKNDRAKIVETFCNMDNWAEVNKRIDDLLKR